MQDYTGDLGYFQDQLKAKNISINQLNMYNFSGLTKDELQYIVDNAEIFMQASADDIFEDLAEFKAMKQGDLSDGAFNALLSHSAFADDCDIVTSFGSNNYTQFHKILQKFDLDDIKAIAQSALREANEHGGLQSWSNSRYRAAQEDIDYRVFMICASIFISIEDSCDQVYDILEEKYRKRY